MEETCNKRPKWQKQAVDINFVLKSGEVFQIFLLYKCVAAIWVIWPEPF